MEHQKSVDGASLSIPHWSPRYHNPWNNLLYTRDARDFINDPEANNAGLGYEECNEIMMHNPEAYNSDESAKYPEKLTEMIKKYFFLDSAELDYNNIKCKFIP